MRKTIIPRRTRLPGACPTFPHLEESPIHKAAAEGSVDRVHELLMQGQSVDELSDDRAQPIHRAAYHGHSDVVSLLLSKNARVSAQRSGRGQPIHCAAHGGHCETLKLLLQQRARLSAEDEKGRQPIHAAAYDGHCAAARLLLAQKGRVDAEDTDKGQPIHKASYGGHCDVINILLDHRAHIDCSDVSGGQPIHAAADGGHSEAVRLLIERGADVQAPTNRGARALHVAAQSGPWFVKDKCCELVLLLLSSRAHLDAEDCEGRRVLNVAVLAGRLEVVRHLIDWNATVDPNDKSLQTDVSRCSSGGGAEIREFLQKTVEAKIDRQKAAKKRRRGKDDVALDLFRRASARFEELGTPRLEIEVVTERSACEFDLGLFDQCSKSCQYALKASSRSVQLPAEVTEELKVRLRSSLRELRDSKRVDNGKAVEVPSASEECADVLHCRSSSSTKPLEGSDGRHAGDRCRCIYHHDSVVSELPGRASEAGFFSQAYNYIPPQQESGSQDQACDIQVQNCEGALENESIARHKNSEVDSERPVKDKVYAHKDSVRSKTESIALRRNPSDTPSCTPAPEEASTEEPSSDTYSCEQSSDTSSCAPFWDTSSGALGLDETSAEEEEEKNIIDEGLNADLLKDACENWVDDQAHHQSTSQQKTAASEFCCSSISQPKLARNRHKSRSTSQKAQESPEEALSNESWRAFVDGAAAFVDTVSIPGEGDERCTQQDGGGSFACVVCMEKEAVFVCGAGHIILCRTCRRRVVFERLRSSDERWRHRKASDLQARQLDRTLVQCPLCRKESRLTVAERFDGPIFPT